MKKLIFLIPFMLVLSSCGDDNSSTPSNINSDQTSGQATAGIGGGNITPNPDGDNSGSTGGSTTNPADTGSDESGSEVVDVEVVPSDPGGTIVVEIVKEGYFNKDAKSFLFPAQKYYYRSLLSSSEQEVYDFLMEKFITFNQTKLGPCDVDNFFLC